MTFDFYDNLQKATSNLSDITFEKYGTVTKISDDFVSVLVDDSLEHDNVPVLNGTKVQEGDRVVVGFVDNNNYNPVILGVLGKVNDTEYVSKDWARWYCKQPLSLLLSSDTHYVEEGESFILTGTLHNYNAAGFRGEQVTLTGDDGSSYTITTNGSGVATQTITSINNDTSFVATYEDLTATCDVELVLFYDKGSIDNHRDDYSNTGFTRSFNEDYTTLTETSIGTSGTYKSVSFPQNCEITLKVKCDGSSSNSIMRLFNNDTVLANASLTNVGLTQDGQFHKYSITCTSDGRAVLSSPETSTTLTRTYTPFEGNIKFGFWSSGDTTTISFKDIVIKEI